MGHNIKKLRQDLARCTVRLKRRDGVKSDQSYDLIYDYYDALFDDDPLAQEYRQLQIALGLRRKNNDDEDPDGPPQRERKKSPHKPTQR